MAELDAMVGRNSQYNPGNEIPEGNLGLSLREEALVFWFRRVWVSGDVGETRLARIDTNRREWKQKNWSQIRVNSWFVCLASSTSD